MTISSAASQSINRFLAGSLRHCGHLVQGTSRTVPSTIEPACSGRRGTTYSLKNGGAPSLA